jgi:hypothetical protein
VQYDDWPQSILAARVTDGYELVQLIALLIFGLIGGLATLLKKWHERRQQEKQNAAAATSTPPRTAGQQPQPAQARQLMSPPFGDSPDASTPPPLPPMAAAIPRERAAVPAYRGMTPSPHIPTSVQEWSVRRSAVGAETPERAIGKEALEKAVLRTVIQLPGASPSRVASDSGVSSTTGAVRTARQAVPSASPGSSASERGDSVLSIVWDSSTRSRAALRKAFVLSEILSPPIALREPTSLDRFS